MRYILKHLVLFLTLILLPVSTTLPQNKNTTDENTIRTIIDKFSDEDPYANGEAISEVVKYGENAIDYLIEYLQSENENVRWCSAIALGKIAPDGERAIPYLNQALKDNDSNVRWCSVVALGNFGQFAKESIPDLLTTLNNEDENIRWASYIAIKKINPEYYFRPPDLSDVVSIIDSIVPSLMQEFNVLGVSVVLIKNNKISFTKSFGVKDVQTSSPVTNETMFEACSMSKPVFAYVVLKLVEQNKLELDKPLSSYLSEEFVSEDDDYSNQVTARMILSHNGGFPNWRKGEEEREGPLPIYFKPGERFSYSGEGYFYLQRVIEKITEKSLEENAKEFLFQPAGLNHSSFIWSSKIDSLISCGHDTSGKYLAKSKYLHPNSAYTLYITAEDFARFIIEILKSNETGNHAPSKNIIDEMLTPQIDVVIRDPIERPGRALGLYTSWGLGWAIDSTASGKIYYHSGANRTGFRCYSQFRIDDGSGIVIMTNGLNGSELWIRLVKEIGDF
jgi:CubicO group peptidase (beta-lactamase class C family)